MAKEHVIGPYSAYAIAVKHGFVGTEAEWATLQKNAPEYARNAAQSAESAAGSAANAASSQKAAATSENAAEAAKTAASQSAQAASTSAASASSAQTEAKASADAAQAAEQAAEEAASRAQEVADSIPEDYTALAEAVRLKAPAIICEASGDIVTVTDAAAEQVVSLVSHIEPVQEGTGDPSPDNVRPISGWDEATAQRIGKNLLPYPYVGKTGTVNGVTFAVNDDGTITLNGTSTNFVSFVIWEGDASFEGCMLTGCPSGGNANTYSLRPKTASGATNKRDYGTGLLLDEPIVELLVVVSQAGVTFNNVVFAPMICDAKDSGSAYEPYQGQVLSADLPETVYGGTLDWITGLLTVDRTCELLLNDGGWVQGKTNPNYYINYNYGKKMYYEEYNKSTLICTHGVWMATNKTPVVGTPSGCVYGYSKTWIGMTSDYSTLDEFVAWLDAQQQAGTPVTVVYKLDTPYTIQLTPQQLTLLKGTNNVWSSTGQTDLQYIADTKLYINDRIAAIAAAALSNN